ncbi:molybdopterin cofactor-binding domain-containing protein [Pseudonocardia sp. GCM10023141]|uniref:molybdopterin cofactor-binding domain-containing protein n=1 Tax=Pseudonocardia sp. GCM10023141 TaxID=3252653 RepID=UPI00360FC2F6
MIGERRVRREDLRLLRGRGEYVDDIDLPGVLHMAAVRSTQPHARILNIDTSAATGGEGVVAVYTAADLAEINRPWPVHLAHSSLRPAEQRTLPIEKVRYVGELVAVVVAESRYLAEDACELVVIDYEPLPGSGHLAVSQQLPVAIHDGIDDNVAAHVVQSTGDVEAALAAAPRVLRETYSINRGGGHSMEGRAVAARYDRAMGEFVVWDATQTPHQIRAQLAYCYGLSEEKIRVIAPPDVGGGFGPKAGKYPEEIIVPWLAKLLDRPVKFVEDRYEHFVSCTQEHLQEHHLEVAYDDDGMLLGLKDVFLHDTGAYASSLIVPLIAGTTVPGPYKIPNLHIEFTSLFTNKVPSSAVRGAGRPQGVFVMERVMDRIAEDLGLDPADVRARNLIQEHEFPYAVGLTFRDGSPLTYDSGNYPGLLEKGLAKIDYPRQRELQAKRRGEGALRGIGVSVAVEGVGLGPFEGATVRMESNGRVTAIMGAPPQGQGFETTYAQICAEAMGVDPDSVDVVTGDTGTIAYGVGTFASRVMATAGPAMMTAASEVKQKLFQSVAAVLEVSPDDLEIRADGVGVSEVGVRGTQTGMPLAQAARMSNVGSPGVTMLAGTVPGLTATSYFNPSSAGYSSSVQVCVVEIDPGTGEVEILDWVVGHDCGTIINPLLVEGQVLGGVVHGLSNALYEESLYSADGTPLTTSFLDYPIPSARELPMIELYDQSTPSPLNPLGVKGAGEAGTLGVPAVIASAVEDALAPLGVRITSMPLSPGRIGDLIEDARIARQAAP